MEAHDEMWYDIIILHTINNHFRAPYKQQISKIHNWKIHHGINL